jgi:hypothetical protein
MKRWRKRLGYLTAGLLFLAALLAWEGRAIAMLHLLGGIHLPAPDPDFAKLESRLPLDSPSLAEMYEGLPHPREAGEFARELWTTSNQSIAGHRFYKKPARPSPEVQAVLLDVLNRKESFEPYPGPKMCGGYHADFAARLESGGKSIWFLVCLGCHEVIIQADGKEMICDLESRAARRLEEAWMDFQGLPFSILETRLPLRQEALGAWGFIGKEAWNDPWATTTEGTRLRLQDLAVKAAAGESQEEMGYWRLTEESHPSEKSAGRQMQRMEKARAKKKGQGRWQEGFAHGDKVYWIWVYDERALDEGLRFLDRLRRYCEETSTHEVRFYK